MAVIVRRLLILPLIALYFASAFCGEGLHSLVCNHRFAGEHSACELGDCALGIPGHDDHAEAGHCCGHVDEGHSPSETGWHANPLRPVHDEQGCAVCQFLAKAQLATAANQHTASRPVQSALAARAPVALVIWSAASYDPRGPPAFSA